MKRAAVLAASTRWENSVPINQKNQTAIKTMKSHKYSNFGAQNLCGFPNSC